MKRIVPVILAVFSLTACYQPRIVPPPGEHPIQTISPADGGPLAIAWHEDEAMTMGLDTGATQNVLMFSPSLRKFGGRIRGRGMMRTSHFDVSLLKDEPPITKQVDVVVVNESPFDGLIGWAAIRKYVWNLNLPDGTQNFYTSLPPRVKKWDRIRLDPNSDYAQIRNNKGIRMIIDTGAPHALYISKKHWERFKEDYPDAFVSVYSGFSPAAGGFYALECMRIQSYRIGDLELRNIIACESFTDKDIMNIDHDIDILVGMGAFLGREFWLDGPNNSLYFSSRKSSEASFPSFNIVGATFIPQKDGSPPYTAKVAKWSTAWEEGLRTGDELVSLNGRRHPDQNLIDYVTTQAGATADMVVKRKNKRLEISWTAPEIPEPGEYHPTPEAVTQEIFEQHLNEQLQAEITAQQQAEGSKDPAQKTEPANTPN